MKGKMLKKVLICFLSVVLALSFTVSVFAAELTDEDKQNYIGTCQQFFAQLYNGCTEEELDAYAAQGDFYSVAVEEVRNNRDVLGTLINWNEGEVVEDGDTTTVILNGEFENLDAQITYTFDAETESPTNLVVNPDYPLSVKLAEAGMNFGVGITIVFIILIFLCIIIWLFKFINKGSQKKQKEEAAKAVPVKAAPAAAPAVEEKTDDAELIAVMAAAIAAAEEEPDAAPNGYYVYSIRRIRSKRTWKKA